MNTQQTDRALPVAITGLGAITPYGDNADVFFKALVAGAHAFVPIKLFATHEHRTRVGAEIRELAVPELKRTDKDGLSRCDLLALTAAFEALKHSRLLDVLDLWSSLLSAGREHMLLGADRGTGQ